METNTILNQQSMIEILTQRIEGLKQTLKDIKHNSYYGTVTFELADEALKQFIETE